MMRVDVSVAPCSGDEVADIFWNQWYRRVPRFFAVLFRDERVGSADKGNTITAYICLAASVVGCLERSYSMRLNG